MLIERSVYTTFMLLGDVGGLQGIFISFAAIIVSFITHNNPENFLVQNLYFRSQKKKQGASQVKELDARKQISLVEYL